MKFSVLALSLVAAASPAIAGNRYDTGGTAPIYAWRFPKMDAGGPTQVNIGGAGRHYGCFVIENGTDRQWYHLEDIDVRDPEDHSIALDAWTPMDRLVPAGAELPYDGPYPPMSPCPEH